ELVQARTDVKAVFASAAADLWQALQFPLEANLHGIDRNAGLGQHCPGQTVFLIEQSHEQMLDFGLLLAELLRQPLGGTQNFLSLLREAFDVHKGTSTVASEGSKSCT